MKKRIFILMMLTFITSGCSGETTEHEILEMYRIEQINEKGVFTTKTEISEHVEVVFYYDGEYRKSKFDRQYVKIAPEDKVITGDWGIEVLLTLDSYNEVFSEVPQ